MKLNKTAILIIILIFFIIINILLFLYFNYFQDIKLLKECIIYKNTGYYCLGCGGTRAIDNLVNFNIIKSIYFNPFVIYCYLIFLWYLITEIIFSIIKKENKLISKNISTYIWIGIIILFINWFIKFLIQLNVKDFIM